MINILKSKFIIYVIGFFPCINVLFSLLNYIFGRPLAPLFRIFLCVSISPTVSPNHVFLYSRCERLCLILFKVRKLCSLYEIVQANWQECWVVQIITICIVLCKVENHSCSKFEFWVFNITTSSRQYKTWIIIVLLNAKTIISVFSWHENKSLS